MRQRRPQPAVDRPALVGDGPDVARTVEHQPEERVVGEVAGHRHRDRTLVVDFTDLARAHLAPQEGVQVDPDHERAGRRTVDQPVAGRKVRQMAA